MQPHRQMLEALRRELAQQRSEWESMCETLTGLGPGARIHLDPAILAEIDAACRVAPAVSAAPRQGLRA